MTADHVPAEEVNTHKAVSSRQINRNYTVPNNWNSKSCVDSYNPGAHKIHRKFTKA